MTIIDELLRPGVLALCQLRTHALKEVSDQHFENSSYSLFEIHICCGNPTKQLDKQPGSSPTCSDLRPRTTNNLD